MKKQITGILLILLIGLQTQAGFSNSEIAKPKANTIPVEAQTNESSISSEKSIKPAQENPRQNNAVKIDETTKTISVAPTGDVTTAINNALQFLVKRPDNSIQWKVNFAPGEYLIDKPIRADKLRNVIFFSSTKEPAILKKSHNFSGEYLFYNRFGKDLIVDGFQFIGKSKTYDVKNYDKLSNPVWTDQGVYFGSCSNVIVTNSKFFDFGNAALRITTSEADSTTGINSFNSKVTNNYFENCFQVTTTSNSEKQGATANYLFENNHVVNLHGSIKFASRTAGAKNVKILNNKIIGSHREGFEISCYSNLELIGNEISDAKTFAVNLYTNTKADKGFDWGNNITIKNNKISDCARGMRLSFSPFKDNYQFLPKLIDITDNTISNITNNSPAINILNGPVSGLTITGNKLSKIANDTYFTIPEGSKEIKVDGNTLDDKIYNEYKLLEIKR